MLFSTLARYFDRLERISSRLEMTAVLANLLKEAAGDEVRQVCYLSLGRLGPLYESRDFNIAHKLMIRVLSRAYGVSEDEVRKIYGEMGDLGDVAEKLAEKGTKGLKGMKDVKGVKGVKGAGRGRLTVNEVFGRLDEIARREGEGSVEQKIAWLAELLRRLDPLSSKFVVRIPLSNMRLGFTEKTLIEALSWMEVGDKSLKKEIEAAYHVYPDIGGIAGRFKEKGLEGIKGVKIKIGAPVLPALCQRLGTPEEIIEKLGGKVRAEPKFDGERIQLHLDRRDPGDGRDQDLLEGFGRPPFLIKMYTRNLEEVSGMFPELLLAADKEIRARTVILDGEAVGIDPQSGSFIPFQQTIQRKRKYGVRKKAKEIPVKYFVFDILHKDGRDLLNLPFSQRREILEETVKGMKGLKGAKEIAIAPQKEFSDPKELRKFLAEEVAKGAEGLVVKDPQAAYEAGARGFSWIKYKPEKDTIDAVVIGYYCGRGKRADFGIGAFLIGVYDPSTDGFKTLSKIGTGLTDEQWREMKRRCDRLKTNSQPKAVNVPKELIPSVWVKPSMVVEIQYDEITKSPLHSAGCALRFPRLVSWREDKGPTEATTVREIRQMFKDQKS